ncbi:MAG: hypothetical protein R3B07_15430 [Polyangiaceae bacterium]
MRYCYFLGAILALAGCGKSEEPAPVGAASASAQPSAAEAPSASAAPQADKPFAERFTQIALKDFRVRLAELPKDSPDLPRDAEKIRDPQLPFKAIYSSRDSLCGVTHSGSLNCFSGGLSGKTAAGWTSAAMGDGFVIGIGGGLKLVVVGDAPLKLGTAEASDAGADAGGEAVAPDAKFRAVAASGENACAVEQSGATHCWSNNATCDLTPPAGLSAGQIALGGDCFACATSDGGVRCWGTNAPTLGAKGNFSRLVAGKDFVCALEGEKATCSAREVPGAVKKLVAAGKRLCWLDAEGSIACDKSEVGLKGKFSDLAITEKWACAADETGYWTCDGATIPGFEYWKSHPAWAPTADGRKAAKAARTALLSEFADRFKVLEAPAEVTLETKVDVGPRVETKYLPLIQNVGLDWTLQPDRLYRYGARINGVKGGTYLLMIDPFGLTLFAFGDAGELKRKIDVARVGNYDEPGFAGGVSSGEEYISFSLDARGILKLKGQRLMEKHEFEPIQKKDVVQCTVYEGALTVNVAAKVVPAPAIGWSRSKNAISNGETCEFPWAAANK